jgi:hypothetical protein
LEDIYVSVTDDDIVYHLFTSRQFKRGSVDDDWVGCVLSLLSVASSKCNVGLMYLPHLLDLNKGENNKIDNEDNYSLDGYSHVCGLLRYKNKMFYVIGSHQTIKGWEGWVFSLLGESPPRSVK